ncbi:BAG domain-containing protein [Aspergillus californicus]
MLPQVWLECGSGMAGELPARKSPVKSVNFRVTSAAHQIKGHRFSRLRLSPPYPLDLGLEKKYISTSLHDPSYAHKNHSMTQQLPHVSQSSLGETCAFYLDYITASLPSSLHSLHHKFVSPLISGPAFSTPLLRALSSPPDWSSYYRDNYNKAPAILTLVACAIALVVMSWRNLWRRPSPSYQPASTNERPYTYLTPDDIVDPPARAYDNSTYVRRDEDDSEPDKLLLNHRKVTYELCFPAYSINDGALSIGQLRQSAAEVTKTADPNRIRLLYKGKLLDKDDLPCRLEGLKQHSEILCVVSEVQAGARTPSDISEAERTSGEGPRPFAQSIPEIQPKPEKTKRKRKNKELKPPAQPPRPSTLPPPAPNLGSFATPLEQVHGLTLYFHRELLPLCEQYFANPPSDKKARDYEHKKLSETILAQVILKADGIEPSTDETRMSRRALIREVQGILNKLDSAADN